MAVSSSYICCHTHSSSALPTRFSPSLLPPRGVQTQPPQGTGAPVLLPARLRAGTAQQTGRSMKTEPASPLCTLLETPTRALRALALFWHTMHGGLALGSSGVRSLGSPCLCSRWVRHTDPEPRGYSGVIVSERGMASGREAHRNEQQHRRMGNGSSP